MYDFKNANKDQIEAISSVDGPVLIIAGPGTGKTFTLVQRAMYLIQECNVKPEEIMIATFTEKAAKELVTRITDALAENNLYVNINEMYVGTFHSICLRIIKEHLEYTNIKKNFRTLDDFDQKYLIFQNIYKFRAIDGFDSIFSSGAWKSSQEISEYVNNLSEELVDEDDLIGDGRDEIRILGEVLKQYKQLLYQNNYIDFSTIQTEAYNLLINNKSVLDEIHNQIKYIMVDEYQDTNYIQEQIAFLLAGEKKNLCVVGDDDQGLYRFRGATIRNILEFPYKFKENECKIVNLTTNYRSSSDIVDFYNKWMETTGSRDFKFDWGKYRYSKNIISSQNNKAKNESVWKLASHYDEDEWHELIFKFIKDLKDSGKLKDYNQIAFLFNSVKHDRVTKLANFLENNGINVYSPRSDMFFDRKEIKLALGVLMLLFPTYVQGLENEEYKFLDDSHAKYYRSCIELANETIKSQGNKDFLRWIRVHGREHTYLQGTTDYAYSGLLYQMFEYSPFKEILNINMNQGVVDTRPIRNLALLSQVIGKYEYLHRIDVLASKTINQNTEKLFNLYLKLQYDGGIDEFEDDSEYAPSGCVSFLTIHQSKGMEFPIVFVDSLSNVPRKDYSDLISEIEETYFKRPPYEPYDSIKYFDFWRLYYVAFSRAQNLLVLTCNENDSTPRKYFREIYEDLPNKCSTNFNPLNYDFKDIKAVNIKDSYSFTSHITVYETCSLQYKFYKELGFLPVRAGAMIFGTLVHETIEDIHKAAIKGETNTITEENITKWFDSNYASISKAEHSYLAEPQKQAALKQVLRYAEKQNGCWDQIKQAEVDVSLVKQNYIIEGKIDLIKGDNDTVEIVDFKSERKPDLISDSDILEQYRRQLHLYAYLVEQRTGCKVSKMNLYYTGEEDGVPTITYPYTKTAIDGTISSFDDTVKKIMNKEYCTSAKESKTCKNCDFRFYCQKQ